nr:hypothetical protein [Tanacetum cinerariifolium]
EKQKEICLNRSRLMDGTDLDRGASHRSRLRSTDQEYELRNRSKMAFLVTTNVPEIYMQEFWVIATVHHHAIRFKMDNKKHIINLESFWDMLHVCLKVKHKNSKKSNEMYYPRFMKVIIHHFMSKDPFIPRRNKVNWQYVRDDHMFFTIKTPEHITVRCSAA